MGDCPWVCNNGACTKAATQNSTVLAIYADIREEAHYCLRYIRLFRIRLVSELFLFEENGMKFKLIICS